MTSVVKHLVKKGLIKPPGYVDGNIHYETEVGSVVYGTSVDTSDVDIYGFCIPPQYILFPHTVGVIPGFDRNVQGFDQYQKHHIKDAQAHGGRGVEYDISIYNIVKYFRLCLDNNPNMIDSLFTPLDCVRFATPISEMVRENRKMFLHKGCWPKFKGYAMSQIQKMQNKTPSSHRYWMIEKYGYDTKFAAHAIRLLLEAEQIFMHGDINLRRDSDFLKSIRNGDMSKEHVIDWIGDKARVLEGIRDMSKEIPDRPREKEVKELLLNCLEEHYGTLGGALHMPDRYKSALIDIQNTITTALG
jgi:predicted nucleotidyltransferase